MLTKELIRKVHPVTFWTIWSISVICALLWLSSLPWVK